MEKENDIKIIYGRNAVTEALNSEQEIDTLFVLKGASLGKLTSLAKRRGAVVKEVNAEKLNALCGTEKHGGAAAELAACSYSTVEDILEVSRQKGKPPFIIVADEIADPHNKALSDGLFDAHSCRFNKYFRSIYCFFCQVVVKYIFKEV